MQAEGGGYQQKQRAFIPGELFRAFAGGNNGMMRCYLPGIPDSTLSFAVRLARALFQTRNRGQRLQDSGGCLELFLRQIPAVSSGVGGQLLFIKGLGGIKDALCGHAEPGRCGLLQKTESAARERECFYSPAGIPE